MSTKKIKWLFDIEVRFKYASYSFFQQMDEQLRPQFEDHFGRKLNWDKLWLYCESIPWPFIFEQEEEKKYTRFVCELRYGYYFINCEIKWMDRDGTRHFDPEVSTFDEDLIFTLVSFDDEIGLKDRYPGLNEEKHLKTMQINTSFPVILLDGVIAHEGNLLISLNDPSKKEELNSELGNAHQRWNDDALDIEGYPRERGKLHEIYFTEWTEDEKAEFYYDTGSAIDGVHEYLIGSLKEWEFEIIKIEIEAL